MEDREDMSIADKRVEFGSDEAADKQKALRGSGNITDDFPKMARNVYEHLNDEISKKIFDITGIDVIATPIANTRQ